MQVEGAGHMKARVLADENIYLSLEKETVLYNIAVEALNQYHEIMPKPNP